MYPSWEVEDCTLHNDGVVSMHTLRIYVKTNAVSCQNIENKDK